MRPFLFALLVGFVGLASGISARGDVDLARAVTTWLASLDAEQRASALYSFDDDERFDLRLAPMWLDGLRRDAMTDEQWQGWRSVLATTLSPTGLAKVETVMSLERELERQTTSNWISSWFGGFFDVGEQRYHVALFGEPQSGRPFGLRFDGHHVSLNWTVNADGTVSTTPVFLGGEPREIPADSDRAGLRAFAEEEDAARALWESLDASQRGKAEIEFASAWGAGFGRRPLFVGEGERPDLDTPQGLARRAMTPAQRAGLDELADIYFSHLAAPLHAARNAALDAAGRDELHFAWAGSFTPGEPLYYRVQGPTLLIEFDNTAPEADHIHTIVRAPQGDFGRDLLAVHYEHHHAMPPDDAVAAGR